MNRRTNGTNWITRLTLSHRNMQARSRRVQDESSGRIFSSSGCWYIISILLLTPLTLALASSQPLLSISSLTRWRIVTAAGHLRYRVDIPDTSSFCDESQASSLVSLSASARSSRRLRLTRSSRVRSRAPTGDARGGHCGFTRRKWRLRSSSDRKRPGTARYTSRWSRVSGRSGGEAATLHTGHARAPLLKRRTMQPLQTDGSHPRRQGRVGATRIEIVFRNR